MSFVTNHIKWRKQRNKFSHNNTCIIPQTDPTTNPPQLFPTIQSTHCKSTISSLLLSTFSNTSNETTHNNKINKNNSSNFSATKITLKGLGCMASDASKHVSVPAVIRSSADWQEKKRKKNRKKKKQRKSSSSEKNSNNNGSASVAAMTSVDFQDVWCGPGIGFSVDAAASVDCVVARRNVTARGNLDHVEKLKHRQSPSHLGRTTVNSESISSILDYYSDIFTPTPALESFGTARCYRHAPHPSSDAGLAQIMALRGRLLMEERLNSPDHFRDWRLDVDNMSYEQLLELGEKIGYVSTGLKENEMVLNIRKIKLLISNDRSKNQIDNKCSICQEEYESGEEVGRLNCEHGYHFQCIKQWLVHKNFCPVCKQQVVARH